jgi:HemY protein
MRRLLILILTALALSLLIAWAIQHDPGHIRISIGHWLVESNLWVFAGLNCALIVAIFLILSALRGSVQAGKRLSHFFGHSAQNKARITTEKGIIAFLEGNWEQSKKLLLRSARKNTSPIINYLAAAHASNELGQLKEAENLLKKAYDNAPDSEVAIGIAQTRIQLQQGQFESALATLIRLKKVQPHHPFVLKQLKAVYLKLEDWQQLIKLLPELRKELHEDDTALQPLEMMAWQKLLIQKTDDVINRNQLDHATDVLAELWKSMPDRICADVSMVSTYARQLIRIGENAESETLLRISLNQHWHDELVNQYGCVQGANPQEQLLHAENWLKARPNNAALLLALGRLSLQNELWGKALEYFEASRRLHHTPESMAELCRLKLKMKKPQENLTPLLEDLLGLLDLPKMPLPK